MGLDVTIAFMGEDAIIAECSSYHMHHAFMLRKGEKKATDLSSPHSQYICLCNSSWQKHMQSMEHGWENYVYC